MSSMRLFKFFGIALALQLFFLIGGYTLLFGPSGEKQFRNSLLLYAYDPFIQLVITAGRYEGESSMIWPLVCGTLLGVVIYAALVAIVVTFLTRRR
jgi:hypothetical protein